MDGQLRFNAPKGIISPALRADLAAARPQLLALLGDEPSRTGDNVTRTADAYASLAYQGVRTAADGARYHLWLDPDDEMAAKL